jgi:hypothetical protein
MKFTRAQGHAGLRFAKNCPRFGGFFARWKCASGKRRARSPTASALARCSEPHHRDSQRAHF